MSASIHGVLGSVESGFSDATLSSEVLWLIKREAMKESSALPAACRKHTCRQARCHGVFANVMPSVYQEMLDGFSHAGCSLESIRHMPVYMCTCHGIYSIITSMQGFDDEVPATRNGTEPIREMVHCPATNLRRWRVDCHI